MDVCVLCVDSDSIVAVHSERSVYCASDEQIRRRERSGDSEGGRHLNVATIAPTLSGSHHYYCSAVRLLLVLLPY